MCILSKVALCSRLENVMFAAKSPNLSGDTVQPQKKYSVLFEVESFPQLCSSVAETVCERECSCLATIPIGNLRRPVSHRGPNQRYNKTHRGAKSGSDLRICNRLAGNCGKGLKTECWFLETVGLLK